MYGDELISMQPWQVVEIEGTMYHAFLPHQNTLKDKIEEIKEDPVEEVECEEEYVLDNMSDDTIDVNEEYMNYEYLDECLKLEKDDSNFVCQDCDAVFSDEETLKRHVESGVHDFKKLFKCKTCGKICHGLNSFKSHMNSEHGEKTDIDKLAQAANITYNCMFCEYVSPNKTSLASHVSRKHAKRIASVNFRKEGNQLICEVCDWRSPNKRRLNEHIERKHGAEEKYECEFCKKKFKVKGDMRLHVRFKHKESPIACEVCGRLCPNSNSLYVHQKWAHYKPKFECQICHRRMVSQENLDQHILMQHERRETYTCKQCGKSFNENHRLKQHMMTHTGEKPYQCEICKKNFARRTAYRQHLLIHTGQRPYQCDICSEFDVFGALYK